MAATSSDDAIRESDLIFNGTIEELGGSTVAALEAGPNMAVVRVDDLIRSTPVLAQLEGQRMTVELRDPGSVAAGEQYTFYATALLFGESVAVRELAHHPVEPVEALTGRVDEALAGVEDAALRERAQDAELVVSGRVSHVRPSPAAAAAEEPTGPVSEHDPQWWEAVIDVEETVKGEQPPSPTVVLFPASIDVMWADAPKFQAGQEGVWLLRTEGVPAAATELFPSVYTALDPKDFQPRDRVERVQRLLEETS